MKFRKDIQGLRVLAIINLFLFHAYHIKFPNGCIGTDIFFVISGYLARVKLDRPFGIQGLKDYAVRRIKRLLPLYYSTIFIVIIYVRLCSASESVDHLSKKAFKAFTFVMDGAIQSRYFPEVFFD